MRYLGNRWERRSYTYKKKKGKHSAVLFSVASLCRVCFTQITFPGRSQAAATLFSVKRKDN